MNAKDLRLIEYLNDLVDAGVCSLKIEGRTKSVFYLSVVTRAYRQAIDNLYAGRELDPQLMIELERITRRGYHSGFLHERHQEQGELYSKSQKAQDMSGFVALVTEPAGVRGGFTKIDVRGKLEAGGTYEVMSPSGQMQTFTAQGLSKLDGTPLKQAHSGVGVVSLQADHDFEPYSIIRKPMPELRADEYESRSEV